MSRKSRISRRAFFRMSSIAAGAAALAACQPATATQAPAEPTAAQAAQATATSAPAQAAAPTATLPPEVSLKAMVNPKNMPGSPNNPRGWTTALPDIPAAWADKKPLTITINRRVDTGTKFLEGDTIENNPWTRMMKELSDTDFKVSWTWSTGDEAQTKYNLGMASNDLPDFMETIPASIFLSMVEADMLEDVTDAIDMYASDRWKAAWAEYGEDAWTWVSYNGRKYALPHAANANQNDSILWYRKDWLDKLGLAAPKTVTELHDAAVALASSKLGKGQDGLTVGLGACKNMYHTWACDLSPIWAAHGIIPDRWSPDGDMLAFDGIRPEAKEVLALLAQWYKDGVFRPDFYNLSESDARGDGSASILGMHFTPSWGATADTYKNDPTAEWAFTNNPLGPKGKLGRFTESPFTANVYGFRKGVDPEIVKRVIEIANWMIELREDPDRRFHGWENAQYMFTADNKLDPAFAAMVSHAWWIGPIGTRGDGKGDPQANVKAIRYYLDEWTKIPEDKRDAWQETYLNDPVGVSRLSRESTLFINETRDSGLFNYFRALPTPTQVSNGTDMAKLMDQTYVGIITGQQPLDSFDSFVSQWKALGGDQVTNEVNEWWAKKM
jgi:putative aldouronate transport system substrate-binding protein